MSAAVEAVLQYDSARVAASIGVRGGPGLGRSLVFRRWPYSLDVTIEDRPNGLQVIHGLILDEDRSMPIAGARVWLDADTSTESDAFGEFALSRVSHVDPPDIWIRAEGRYLLCRMQEDRPGPEGGSPA